MKPFELTSAARIVFGRGRFEEIGRLAADMGGRLLVVSNADRSGERGLMERLQGLGLSFAFPSQSVYVEQLPEGAATPGR